MVISDPAAEYIESQKASLTDFIFRMTGDRSRAGLLAGEICSLVQSDLMSSWTQDDMRRELFKRAFEANTDALRGIDRSFLKSYYKHQIRDPKKVSQSYPLEIFLQELGPLPALLLLLTERFGFAPEELAEILGSSDPEAMLEQWQLARSQIPKKLQAENLAELPAYTFLAVPDALPTSLSRIKSQVEHRTGFVLPTKVVIGLAIFGFALGWLTYTLLPKIQDWLTK